MIGTWRGALAASMVWVGAAHAAAQSAAPPVDLLHAVTTELAVSSAYRDQRAQVDRLVDGDPTTAWNSRTGELAGAWIEVRLPAGAEVTGVALIPGFARPGGATDLFTGNHRVSAIRVLRDGVEVGRFPVATASPELVTIPVRGAGGVWRIEIAEVLPGSRSDWREACISELQILGRAPSMAPATRVPRTAIGSLPEAPAPATIDPAALDRSQRRELTWLSAAWRDLQSQQFDWWENTGEPEPDPETTRDMEQRRATIVRRVVALVEPVDAAAADAVRMAGAHRYSGTAWRWNPTVLADLDAIGRALDVVAARIGSDEARCRSARTQAEIRLMRVAELARLAGYFDEIDGSEGGGRGASHSHALERESEALQALHAEWPRNARGVASRLLRRDPPTDEQARGDWGALRAQLEIAQTACGWATGP